MKAVLFASLVVFGTFQANALTSDQVGECVIENTTTQALWGLVQGYGQTGGLKEDEMKTAREKMLSAEVKSCRDLNLVLVDLVKTGLERSKE